MRKQSVLVNRSSEFRAILYLRVSTDEQAEKGYSLRTQLDACRKYAEAQGYMVVAVFQEDYTGAVPIERRPEGQKAYAMLSSGEADALIAYTIDRLVRPPEEGDEWEMPLLIRGLAKLGKEIHTVNRGKLDSSFASLLIAMLDAKSAGDERRKIIERVTRGKNAKARDGHVVGTGTPLFGYAYQKEGQRVESMVVVESEASIVRIVYRWYVYGDENGKPLSVYGIRLKLTGSSIPPPDRSTIRRKHKPFWSQFTVGSILRNETYAGVWRYGKRIGKDKKLKRPIDEQIAVSVPAIVDRELWEAAQERRKYNQRMAKRNCKREYLLRAMVTCGVCGGSMYGTGKRRNHYYYCSRKNYNPLDKDRCRVNVRAELVEAKVWHYILDVWSDPQRFEKALQDAQKAEQNIMQPKRERFQAINEMIVNCEHEVDAIISALKRAHGFVGKRLEMEMTEVEKRHAALTKERDELQAELQAASLSDANIRNALQFREDVVRGMLNPTFEDKRRALELLRVEVTVKDKKAQVKCLVPVSIELDLL